MKHLRLNILILRKHPDLLQALVEVQVPSVSLE